MSLNVKMSEKSVAFKLAKSANIVVIVLGLIASGLLLLIGLYALGDGSSDSLLYRNAVKYYGINQDNFEPVIDATQSVTSVDNRINQSTYGTLMVFVAIVSFVFESIALFGVIRENLIITSSILFVLIVSLISALFTTKTIDFFTLATHLFYILLNAVYVILLKMDINARREKSGESVVCGVV